MQTNPTRPYWHTSIEDLFKALGTNESGLGTIDASRRLTQYGSNELKRERKVSRLRVFVAQFKSPLMLMLLFATAVSALLRDWEDALIILLIVLGSSLLSAAQEYRASVAIEALRARIAAKAKVLRDGQPHEIPSTAIVPGDIVLLSAGSIVPADGVLIQAKDLYVSQAVLTGESFPVEKEVGITAADASVEQRTNCVFMGTNVRSGTARAVIVNTGRTTVFGQVAERLTLQAPETEFEHGIRHFGSMLVQVTLLLTLIVFAVNVFFNKPVVDSLLFSVALAVGMAPEMLPGIVTITLSQGARTMAGRGVIVRRLTAIENFGSMDVLCTDKTGTLTEGEVRLEGTPNVTGQSSPDVLRYAYLNAHLQSGLSNPLDDAIVAAAPAGIPKADKVDEIPYDFVRKRLSVVVEEGIGPERHDLLITKGALDRVLAVCTYVRKDSASVVLNEAQHAEIQQRYAAWSGQGLRVLGVATKQFTAQDSAAHHWSADDECDMTFEGFLLFLDPPKASATGSIADLARQGVQLKIITGDNKLVALHTAEAVHLPVASTITGAELNNLTEGALLNLAERTDLFAEVDPAQKERIIAALRKTGHVVGFLGDGINDAPALHTADVGISVDSAVDVAKQAADLVLLEQDLSVLSDGITLGRNAFANTLKYIYTTISGNFGNMFSMALTSLFLPFLPMLPKQILFENFLSDVPLMTVVSDNVDHELVDRPVRWNIPFLRNFMVVFGIISSAFDFVTFGILLFVVHSAPNQFQTGWFLESLLTELFVMLVMRTRRVFYQSRPGRWLTLSTLVVSAVGLWLPYSPLAGLLGFTLLPVWVLTLLLGITALYVLTTEVAKREFYRRVRA